MHSWESSAEPVLVADAESLYLNQNAQEECLEPILGREGIPSSILNIPGIKDVNWDLGGSTQTPAVISLPRLQ